VIIPNVGSTTLFPIIRARIKPDAVVYSDSFQAYDVLDVSEFRHLRINHRELFAELGNHINGIENFWSQARRHLRRYNGIPRAHFPLSLKECEWRFNRRPANRLLAILKTWLNETRSVPI
jgi:transposase